jgi:phosphate/phosphite/phosphonate ABC transporter binding protein
MRARVSKKPAAWPTSSDMHHVPDDALVFGLVADHGESEASASFEAFASWIREHQGLTFVRQALPTYRALAESVREGTSDIAWLPPAVYAWLAEAVTPLGCIVRGALGSSTSYSAALVALEDSPLHALDDLRGKRAGWVDPWSAAGYVVPRIELAKALPRIAFASETFYGSHKNALLALARGDCDVAGTYARSTRMPSTPSVDEAEEKAFEGAWSAMEGFRVRVIATFSSIPSDVIAVRRNLDPTRYELALKALREAGSDEAARPLVRAVFGGDELREGIEPGHDAFRIAFESATAKGLFD